MGKSNKLIIQVCLCGAGTKKSQAPTVPYTPEEISDQIVSCAKLGASIAHIHVREDKEVNGNFEVGYKSMSLQKFTETVELTREKCAKEGLDVIINLPTSGGEYEDHKRLQHLGALKPEMCSFDPNTLNWANSYIFENSPRMLNKLAQEVVKNDIKPEFEVFDTGHIDSVMYYVNKHGIPQPPHIQFIMGVGGLLSSGFEQMWLLRTPGNMSVTYQDKKGNEVVVTAEGVLAAAGRCANIDGLFAEGVEIEMFKNAIVGDEVGRTSLPKSPAAQACRNS